MKKVFLVGLILSLTVVSAQQTPLTSVATSLGSLGNPFFVRMSQGVSDQAKKLGGASVSVVADSADYDIGKQTAQIDNYIAKKAQILVLNAVDPKGMVPAVRRAKAAGMIVIGADVGVDEGADAIITSGGVSVGEADFTKTMMKKLGDVAFWRIAMRPGRPMAVGRILPIKSASSPINTGISSYQTNSNPDGAVLFGLPGNPVAVMVTFLAFVRPALLQMMGARPKPDILLKARSAHAIRKKPGRTEYQRGRVTTAPDGSLHAATAGNQGSGVLSSMAEANGLIVLHHGQGNVAAGDEVDVLMFDGVI